MDISQPPQSEIDSVIKLFSNGQLEEALSFAHKLIESFPNHSLLNNIIGACYAGLDELESAVKSYEKAIDIDPYYAKAHYNLGDVYQELGQYKKSIDSYKKSLSIDSKYAEAHNNLGNVYAANSQSSEAILSFKKALSISPDYFEAYYGLAMVLHDKGEIEQMIEQLEKALILQPDLAEVHNKIGVGYQELGQPDKAIKYYQKAIESNPNFSESYNNLGNVLREINKLHDAVEIYNKAIKINPDFPSLHNNLGNVFRELGQLNDALGAYKNALTHNPDYPESLNNMGIILNELNQFDEALKNYEKALDINPNYSDVFNNLGNLYKDFNMSEEAIQSYEKAILIDPDFVEAHNNLGNTLKDSGQLNQAVKCFERALQISPEFSGAHNNFGIVYINLGQLNDALKCFQRAILIDPDFVEAHNNLGNVLKDLGQYSDAVRSYEKAISIEPNFSEAYNNLGTVYSKDLGRPQDAITSFKQAIDIHPNFAVAYNNLGNVFKDLEHFEDALTNYEKAMTIEPDLDYVIGNILATKINYCNWDNLSDLIHTAKLKITDNKKAVEPFTLSALIDDPALQRKASEIRINSEHPKSNLLSNISSYSNHLKIRIGYFSADFREHPLAYLTAGLFEVHDRDHFEIYAFSFGPDTQDDMNLRIKAGMDHFHNVEAMSNKEITLLARSLEIDIAVDLGGFTDKARTDIFAMSAAPIQISYIGWLVTMGADYYDYLIADTVMIPKESQKYYSEKIVYLPCFQVNDSRDLPPQITLTRQDLGLPKEGFIFCCFNHHYKFTPKVFDSWARIISAVKGSFLIVYANNELARTNLTNEIVKRDINPSRLIFADRYDRQEYLARYRVTDLFLDTHPCNAGTTASDALKMGLPIVTMKGRSFGSREAASILASINLPELITNTPEDYESLAIELATKPEKLKVIKVKLASNLSSAPLYDTKLFTKNLESAYKQMYDRNQKGLRPDHIYVEK